MHSKRLANWCHGALSVDLEISLKTDRITSMAAVRRDTREAFTWSSGSLSEGLRTLDRFAEGVSFLLGHNLLSHDRPYLAAHNPRLALLRLPALDTLMLSPLAFPRHPYHHLVKHYKDGGLRRGILNNPELDARITLKLFDDECEAFGKTDSCLLLVWHGLTAISDPAFGSLFSQLRAEPRPATEMTAQTCLTLLLEYGACVTAARRAVGKANNQIRRKERKTVTAAHQAVSKANQHSWELMYALAWLSVAGGNSVMPPWVRHEFPGAAELVRNLRDTPCRKANCDWCRARHDPLKELKRWTGFDQFRSEPAYQDQPMQQVIVEASMRRDHVLGILPTGTGKSLCYQVPALSRYHKTGALTVVISPLVALMADQVHGMQKKGMEQCAAINSLLTMPERSDVLDRVRLGEIAILITSPEQLRSPSLRKTLEQREIGAWVLDEAHCLAKWGHDFRPDYRYVSRFIAARSRRAPPILCLTATAKPGVINEILKCFQALKLTMKVYNGGSERNNLEFEVVPSSPQHKYTDLLRLLEHDLFANKNAIIYCSTRRGTEELAEFLVEKRNDPDYADYYHSDIGPERKKQVQARFIEGNLQIIVATNAFGMGIDKPDIRLVVHVDMPGSLENYLQEAGRAGRDQKQARCVLLFTPEDIENQFRLSARSRLGRVEINAALKAIRRLNKKKHNGEAIEATAGEILLAEDSGEFQRDSATDDTRVRTAVAWLENAQLLRREENRVSVFPSSLRISSIEQAKEKIAKQIENPGYRKQLLELVDTILHADADEGISTDELMGATCLDSDGVRKAMYDLEALGICHNDTELTAYVHKGVQLSSEKRLAQAVTLERALLRFMRENAPDMMPDDQYPMLLRGVSQQFKDAGLPQALPERLRLILRSLAADGRDFEGRSGSIALTSIDRESVMITLKREWDKLEQIAERRRAAAACLLQHWLTTLPNQRGVDLLAQTTMGNLYAAIKDDLALQTKDPRKLSERALLWLHELEIIRLNKGLLIFRSAMTIRLDRQNSRRQFQTVDFEPLKIHYDEAAAAIHIMCEYARLGLEDMRQALHLAADYFRLPRQRFLDDWLPDRKKTISLQTSPESWRAIVEPLNTTQKSIVADKRERTNMLVLAGPGSGKTRVIVHRIAYLARVRRENPHSIAALTYNRHAAVEIRRRLLALIDKDAYGVTVMTCHALSMRLCGASFAARLASNDTDFSQVLQDATKLLNGDLGDGALPEEADQLRERLLAGFHWILVDEYQDMDEDQYNLISALAGRTLSDDSKLNLLAVGDDDQNIYSFKGASVKYIRRFSEDYQAKPVELIENYRSTANIIQASNQIISRAANRMKSKPIQVDRNRQKLLPGGVWAQLDPVAKGRVQLLECKNDPIHQALIVMDELMRLQPLNRSWNWSNVAVIAREWKYLEPVRACCEIRDIPVRSAAEENCSIWRLRETQALVAQLRNHKESLVAPKAVRQWIGQQMKNSLRVDDRHELKKWLTTGGGSWWRLLKQALSEYMVEYGDKQLPPDKLVEWLAEWTREARQQQRGILLLTAHRAKGLEFDHVCVLDGSWEKQGKNEDPDATRRLYYVAMTRARYNLVLLQMGTSHPIINNTDKLPRQPMAPEQIDPALYRRYKLLSPADINLGYAGRFAAGDRIHNDIAKLQTGDLLTLQQENGGWFLVNRTGQRVGKLARAFNPEQYGNCVEGHVNAILVRHRDDGSENEEYTQYIKVDRWETPLPELVFEKFNQSAP